MEKYPEIIEQIWNNRELLSDNQNVKAIEQIIELLDKGKLRVAHQFLVAALLD